MNFLFFFDSFCIHVRASFSPCLRVKRDTRLQYCEKDYEECNPAENTELIFDLQNFSVQIQNKVSHENIVFCVAISLALELSHIFFNPRLILTRN